MYNLYSAFDKSLGMRSILCYTLPLDACMCEGEVEKALYCVLHSDDINVSKATIVTDTHLVACVTSKKENTTVKYTARSSWKIAAYALEINAPNDCL
jgi:hypothetical protein